MKTIQELNQKMWYRAIKSIYILSIISIILISIIWFLVNYIFYGYAFDDELVFMFFALIWFLFYLKILKHTFYYIVLWKLFPNKKTNDNI